MDLFNFFKRNKIEQPKQMDTVSKLTFAGTEIPIIRELKNKDYVPFGIDNLYPQHLYNLLSVSSTHSSIVTMKSKMMAGDGFLFNGATDKVASKAVYDTLDPTTKAALDTFLDNPNDDMDIEEIISKVSKNYQTYGQFALEVVWSMDFSRIATIKYVDAKTIRTGKYVNGKICNYYISRHWENEREYPAYTIAAFNPEDKENYNQLIWVKTGDLEYYGEPPYLGSMEWIDTDSRMARFHNSNIKNGFAPSVAINFYKLPASPEEQKRIVDNINKQKAGENNAGKGWVFFSDGKDEAPEVKPVDVSNLDKQYIALSELAVQNILTGSQITSPQLFGITTPGSLSQGSELTVAYNIFNKSVIEPDRKLIEKVLNKILKINKIGITIELAPFNPLPETKA